MSGGNSITYYAPTILVSIGLDSAQVLLFTAIYGLIKVVSVFLYAFFLTDRFGRRPLLLIGSTINTLCLTYLAAFLGVSNISDNASPSPAAWVAIEAICIFANQVWLWLGSRILPNGVQNLPDLSARPNCVHYIHVPKSA
ncbi:uncharacterized protein BDV14DRAFT_176562 [Aspergillus stella-maris]|uniref:uncharacterized protein n=1 Tax=Aspergillus stella-maris TaxID=1810926 RepID=UPI003CCD3819